MENRNHMIPDEQLNAVSGGAGEQPAARFAEGDFVKIAYSASGGSRGRILVCVYNGGMGEWTYRVEYGGYQDGQWVSKGLSGRYVEESVLQPLTRSDMEL